MARGFLKPARKNLKTQKKGPAGSAWFCGLKQKRHTRGLAERARAKGRGGVG